jgi:oligopeptide/dipeptide ABC transporter ATP-binding protein
LSKILEIKDLEMNYITKEERVRVINDVSFYVNEGETFGLVGESGCGKSSVCRSILQLLPPSASFLGGSIKYKGEELLGKTDSQLQKIRGKEISISFQESMTALNPVTTIKEQIFEQYRYLNYSKEEKYQKALEMLRLVGIPSPEQRIKEYVHQFSGGMRQRIMIAIALAASPSLLLADEPTTALDVTIQDQIIKLLNKLKETLNMSMILVTHDLGVVSQMCDRIAVMYAGYIVETSDTLTIFSKPRHPYTEGLIGSMPRDDGNKSKLVSIPGAPPNLNALPEGCPFHPRCKYVSDICKKELPLKVEVEPGHWSMCHHTDKLLGKPGLINVEREVKV